MYALQCYIYQNVLTIILLAQFCRSLKSLEKILLGQLLGPQMWPMSLVRYFHLSWQIRKVMVLQHGDWLGREIQKLQCTSTKASVCGSRLLFYKVKEPFPWVEQSGRTSRCMAFYETVCCWLLFRIPCPVCYLYVSTICMCVWVGYQRPSKIICSQKGSTLCQGGVEKELAFHCKRRIRGVEETTRLIEDLINSFSSDKGKDTMSIPLLNKTSIQQIW